MSYDLLPLNDNEAQAYYTRHKPMSGVLERLVNPCFDLLAKLPFRQDTSKMVTSLTYTLYLHNERNPFFYLKKESALKSRLSKVN